jgi:hypothetical protein
VNNVDLSAGELVKFTLCQHDFIPIPGHNIGGDVDANWTVIRPLAAQSDGGEILFFLKDHSILVQGGANGYSIYTVVTHPAATGITGFRLEALEHRALPFRGPGRQEVNGNMHLSEFKVEVTTEKALRPGSC